MNIGYIEISNCVDCPYSSKKSIYYNCPECITPSDDEYNVRCSKLDRCVGQTKARFMKVNLPDDCPLIKNNDEDYDK